MTDALLYRLAHARSGDKGDTVNVGVIARRPEFYELLRRELTTERVRVHFALPHVYFVGSHTGCSCGFSYGWAAGDEEEAGRASVGALGHYLAAAAASGQSLELYACWDGDESKPAAARAEVSPDFFRGDAEEFDLHERWFATVARAG